MKVTMINLGHKSTNIRNFRNTTYPISNIPQLYSFPFKNALHIIWAFNLISSLYSFRFLHGSFALSTVIEEIESTNFEAIMVNKFVIWFNGWVKTICCYSKIENHSPHYK